MQANIYDFQVNPNDPLSSWTWQIRFAAGARSILEIGCATGYISRALTEQGGRVTAIEYNPVAAKQAQAVCNRVVVGDIEDVSVREQVTEQFDVVLLGDVLEHLRDPETVLRYVRQHWLVPGGHVIISIPNAGHWVFRREVLRGRFPYRQYGLFDRTHLRFYTRQSLYEMVACCGYTIEREATTINHNVHDDITFEIFTWLYRHRLDFRSIMMRIEHQLSKWWPSLFAYQFVLYLRTSASDDNVH